VKPKHALAIALFALTAPLAAEDPSGAKEELKQSVTHAKRAAHESRAAFVRRLKAMRVDFHMKVRILQREALKAEKSVRRAAGRKIMAFKNREIALEKKLEALQDESEERWQILKEGVEDAADELKEAYDELKETLK
jgi:hypothetical protein